MQTYFILPDGSAIPRNPAWNDAQHDEWARKNYPDAYPVAQAPVAKDTGVFGSLQRGGASMLESVGGGIAGLFNPTAAGEGMLAGQQQIQQKYGESPVSLDAIKKAYAERGFIAAAGETLGQVPHAVAEQLPNLAAMAGGAKLGAVAGAPLGPAGSVVGGAIGAFAPSFLMQYGGNLGRQADVAKEAGQQFEADPASAIAGAVAQGALDVGSGALLLGKSMVSKLLGKPIQNLAKASQDELVAVAKQTVLRSYAGGAARAGYELPTEIAQQIIERAQAGLSVTDEDAFREYGQTALMTAMSAPVFGAAGRFSERGAGQDIIAQREIEDRAKRVAADKEAKRAAGLAQFRKDYDDGLMDVADAMNQQSQAQRDAEATGRMDTFLGNVFETEAERDTAARQRELEWRQSFGNLTTLQGEPGKGPKHPKPAQGGVLDFFMNPDKFYSDAAKEEMAARDEELRGQTTGMRVKQDPLAAAYEDQLGQIDASSIARKERINEEEASLYAEWIAEQQADADANRMTGEKALDMLFSDKPRPQVVPLPLNRPKHFYQKEADSRTKRQEEILGHLVNLAPQMQEVAMLSTDSRPEGPVNDIDLKPQARLQELLDTANRLRQEYVALAIEEGAYRRAAAGAPEMSRDEALQALRIDAALRELIDRSAALPSRFVVDPLGVEESPQFARPEKQLPDVVRKDIQDQLMSINRRTVDLNRKQAAEGLTDAEQAELFNLARDQKMLVDRLNESDQAQPERVRYVEGKETDRRDTADRPFGVAPRQAKGMAMFSAAPDQTVTPQSTYNLTDRPELSDAANESASLQVLREQINLAKADIAGLNKGERAQRNFRLAKNVLNTGVQPGPRLPAPDMLDRNIQTILADPATPPLARATFEAVDQAMAQNPRLLGNGLRERAEALAQKIVSKGKLSPIDAVEARRVQDEIRQRQDVNTQGNQLDMFPDEATQGVVRASPQTFERFMSSGKAQQMRSQWEEAQRLLSEDTVQDYTQARTLYRRAVAKLDALTKQYKDVTAKIQAGIPRRALDAAEKRLDEVSAAVQQAEAALGSPFDANLRELAEMGALDTAPPEVKRAAAKLQRLRMQAQGMQGTLQKALEAAQTDVDDANEQLASVWDIQQRLEKQTELVSSLQGKLKDAEAEALQNAVGRANAARGAALLAATGRQKEAEARRQEALDRQQKLQALNASLPTTEVARGVRQPPAPPKAEPKAQTLISASLRKKPGAKAKGAVDSRLAKGEAERARMADRGFDPKGYVPTGPKATVNMRVQERAAQEQGAILGTSRKEFERDFSAGLEADDAAAAADALDAFDEYKRNMDFRLTDDAVRHKGVDLTDAATLVRRVGNALRRKANIMYVGMVADLPADVAAGAQAQGIDLNLVQGAVLPDGTVLIIGENHNDIADLERTLAHELVGHLGFYKALNSPQIKWLVDKLQANPSETQRIADDMGVGEKVRDEKDGYTKLKELLARVEEMRPSDKLTDRVRRFLGEVIGAFRHWMRQMGFTSFSEVRGADILYSLRQARQALNKEGLFEGTGSTDLRQVYSTEAGRLGYELLTKGAANESKGLRGWVKQMAFGLRFQLADSKAALQEIYDRTRLLPAGEKQKLDTQNAMYFTRMAERTYNFVMSALQNGAPSLIKQDNGEYLIETGKSPSVVDMFRVAGNRINDYWVYRVFNRALTLPDGLTKLSSSGAITEQQAREVVDAGKNDPLFKQLDEMYNAYNDGLMSFLNASGFLTPEQYAAYKKAATTYVPFIREGDDNFVLDLGDDQAITLGSIANNPELRKIVGGNAALKEFGAGVMLNTSAIMRAGLNNLALRNTAFALHDLGMGTIRKGKQTDSLTGTPSFAFKIDGQDMSVRVDTSTSVLDNAYADIDAAMLVKGMEGVVHLLPDSIQMLSMPARLLRNAIIYNPVYALRQLTRDPMAAWMTTGANINPLKVFAKGIPQMFMERNEAQRLLENRGVIGSAMLEGSSPDVQRILTQLAEGKPGWEKYIAKLGEIHLTADLVTREAQYKSYLAQGMTEQQATMASIEGMNFSRHGQSSLVNLLTQLTPFVNAQIQGLDVMWRAFTKDGTRMSQGERLQIKRKLMQRGMLVAAGTLAYAMLAQDEPWYKNAAPQSRYANWLLPLPGTDVALRIPIPFELGYLFKALPEAVVNEMMMNEPGNRAAIAFKTFASNMMPGGLPFLPTFAKPMIEVAMDYSTFTDRPITPAGTANLERTMQFGDRTTETAKGLSRVFGGFLTPAQIEHLVTGYTSMIGLGVMQIVDAAMGDSVPGGKPERKVPQTPVFGSLFQDPLAGGTIQQAYDLSNRLTTRLNSFEQLGKDGKIEEMRKYLGENREEIAKGDAANKWKAEMNKLNEAMNRIKFAPALSPAEKRQQMDRLQQQRIELAERFVQRFGS